MLLGKVMQGTRGQLFKDSMVRESQVRVWGGSPSGGGPLKEVEKGTSWVSIRANKKLTDAV